MKPSLYLETTIPSYLAARTSSDIVIAGRQVATHVFFEAERQKYNLYVSEYVLRECGTGDADAAQRRLDWLKDVEILTDTPDLEPLARYMRAYCPSLNGPKRALSILRFAAYTESTFC